LGVAAYPGAAAGLRSLHLLAGGKGWPEHVEIRVLDVGQGTAVLVRTPERHAALFDAGPADCDLAGQLRSLGVRKLDLVVISHPHADHFAGLLASLDSLDIETFVDRTEIIPPQALLSTGQGGPAGETSHSAYSTQGEAAQYQRLRRRLESEGTHCLQAAPGSSLSLDGFVVTFFAPRRSLTMVAGTSPWGEGRDPPSGDELNGASLVAVLDAGDTEVLLPGDAEAEVLERYRLPPVDAVVIPHHGSRGAVSERLLTALEAQLALISVGKDNSFGHPDSGTMRLLSAAGDTILRTDESGWVSLRMNDGVLAISTERTQTR
jgi:competence protein ComEC